MRKTFITFLLFVSLLIPHDVEASSTLSVSTDSIEYFSDGSYFLTTISIEDEIRNQRATTTRTASKTKSYVDSSGTTLWSFTITGSFAYNGYTCTCGQAKITTNVYSNEWKFTSTSAVPRNNTAIGNITAKQYINNNLVRTITDSATLTCDVNGNVS